MATITEDHVSFKIAKLLKEKGFDARCPMIYTSDGELLYTDIKHHNMFAVTNKQLEHYTDIIAPSQAMAMKWLREVHNIDIIPFHEKLPNDCYWCRIEKYPYTEYNQDPIYKKYEESLDAAIKYCLEHSI